VLLLRKIQDRLRIFGPLVDRRLSGLGAGTVAVHFVNSGIDLTLAVRWC